MVNLRDVFEPIRGNLSKNGYDNIAKDAGFLLNSMNIRHNNLEGKYRKEYTANLSTEELEEWYDKIYNVLLYAILLNDYIGQNKEIENIKQYY